MSLLYLSYRGGRTLFFTLQIGRGRVGKIFKSWNLGQFNCVSIDEIISHEGQNGFSSRQRLIYQAVIWSTTYMIRRMRNNVIFKGRKSHSFDLFYEVQVLSFFWIRYKDKFFEVSWQIWYSDPTTKVMGACRRWNCSFNYSLFLQVYSFKVFHILLFIYLFVMATV